MVSHGLFDLGGAAEVGAGIIRADGLVRSTQRQQDQHGGYAGAVLARCAVEQDGRFAGFQRPEQLFERLVAGEHLPVHQLGEVRPGGDALHQPLDVVGRKIDLLPGGIPQAADLHQPCAVRHIVRQLCGFCAAAQVKDEPQSQPVQPGAVGFGGQPPGGEAPVNLPPLYGLALVGVVAAQLPEVVAARKGQLGARGGMLRGSFGGGAGKHRRGVEGLCRPSPAGRQAGGAAQDF